MKNHRSTIIGFAILTVLMTAGAAQSLSGSNTVFTDDIVDGTVKNIDIKPSTITGSRILDNSITGADINESTLNVGPSTVVNHDFADATRSLRIQGDHEAAEAQEEVLGSVSFTLPRRAFIGAFFSAEFTDVEEAACPPDADSWSTARLVLQIDGTGPGLNPENEGQDSAINDRWLEAGPHTATLKYRIGSCSNLPSPESGSVTIEDVHLEVVALD